MMPLLEPPRGQSLGRVALPVAPSANRYYRVFQGRPRLSKEAHVWLTDAVYQIRRSIQPTTRPVCVLVEVRMGKGFMTTRDLDNVLKGTMDALKPESRHKETKQITKPGAGVIPDDSVQFVHEIVVRVLPEIKASKTKRGEAEQFVEVFLVD